VRRRGKGKRVTGKARVGSQAGDVAVFLSPTGSKRALDVFLSRGNASELFGGFKVLFLHVTWDYFARTLRPLTWRPREFHMGVSET
jgi:hypothetical protein